MGLCSNDQPDPADGYVAGVLADLETLPARRGVEVGATLGKKVSVPTPGAGGRTVYSEYDFTGLGDADLQRQFADQMAGELLKLQQELGPAFVEQRLKELDAADPQGRQMRHTLLEAIQSDTTDARTAERPGAEMLQDRVLAELEAGGRLPDSIAERVQQDVLGGQVARGNFLGNAAAYQEGEALAGASEDYRSQRQQAALAFLTSGVSPEDVGYRREQQALGNLGSFVAGETPTAQFGQLSGAQAQSVPWQAKSPNTVTNPNAGAQGMNYQQNLYQAQTAGQNNQVNPWIAGLSGAVQGLNIYAAGQG